MMTGQEVLCTWGSMKGERFTIAVLLKNGFYSCKHSNGRYYQYKESHLEPA